jgi:psiF repeat-containing protein
MAMKKLIVLAALAGFCLPALADTAQQEKMKTCNAEAKAKALKGDEHKKFMSECLSAKPAAAAAAPAAAENKPTQQEKMKTCNADAKAKGLKGDEHKKFMSTCLKG